MRSLARECTKSRCGTATGHAGLAKRWWRRRPCGVLDTERRRRGRSAPRRRLRPALGLGHLHPFDGAEPVEVGLELSDHREDVRQQPPDLASQSSLVTTRVSSARHAASASRCPGRSRLVPVGRGRRRCDLPRHRDQAERRVERSDLADRLSIGRTRQAVRSWRTSGRLARTCRGTRLARASGRARHQQQDRFTSGAARQPRPAGRASRCVAGGVATAAGGGVARRRPVP